MKAEVDLPENVQTTTSSYHENNVGGIEFDMIHFDHTSELSCKIRVYDDRPVPGKTGWGSVIFEGTIKDLRKRLIGQ